MSRFVAWPELVTEVGEEGVGLFEGGQGLGVDLVEPGDHAVAECVDSGEHGVGSPAETHGLIVRRRALCGGSSDWVRCHGASIERAFERQSTLSVDCRERRALARAAAPPVEPRQPGEDQGPIRTRTAPKRTIRPTFRDAHDRRADAR